MPQDERTEDERRFQKLYKASAPDDSDVWFVLIVMCAFIVWGIWFFTTHFDLAAIFGRVFERL